MPQLSKLGTARTDGKAQKEKNSFLASELFSLLPRGKDDVASPGKRTTSLPSTSGETEERRKSEESGVNGFSRQGPKRFV